MIDDDDDKEIKRSVPALSISHRHIQQRPGDITLALAQNLLDGVILVSDLEASKALFYLLERAKVLAGIVQLLLLLLQTVRSILSYIPFKYGFHFITYALLLQKRAQWLCWCRCHHEQEDPKHRKQEDRGRGKKTKKKKKKSLLLTSYLYVNHINVFIDLKNYHHYYYLH